MSTNRDEDLDSKIRNFILQVQYFYSPSDVVFDSDPLKSLIERMKKCADENIQIDPAVETWLLKEAEKK